MSSTLWAKGLSKLATGVELVCACLRWCSTMTSWFSNVGKSLGPGILACICYLLIGRFGLQFAIPGTALSVFWMPDAVTLTILLLNKRRHWPFIAVGSWLGDFPNELTMSGSYHDSFFLATIDSFIVLFSAFLIRRYGGAITCHNCVRWVLVLVASHTLLSNPLGGLLTALTVYAKDYTVPEITNIVMTWLLSSSPAAIILVPLLIAVYEILVRIQTQRVVNPNDIRNAAMVLLLVGLVIMLAYREFILYYPINHMMINVYIPILFSAAYFYGLVGAGLCSVVILVMSGLAPFYLEGTNNPDSIAKVVLDLQSTVIVNTTAAMLLATMTTGLRYANQELSVAHKHAVTATWRAERSELLHRLLFDRSRDALMILSPPSWKFTGANLATLQLFGAASHAEFIAIGPSDLSPALQPDGRPSHERAQEMIATAMREGSHLFEWEHVRMDGKPFAADVLLTRMEVGRDQFLQATVRNITKRKQVEEEVLRLNRDLKLLLEEKTDEFRLAASVVRNTSEGVLITDCDAVILAVNPAFSRITGYSAEDVIGRNTSLLSSHRHDDDFYQNMWGDLLRAGYWEGEIWNRHKDGNPFLERLLINAVHGNDGKALHYVAVFNDITETHNKDNCIRHMAYHDALTGLPNRLMLEDRLTRAIEIARRRDRQLGLIFIDLDRFKDVNDILGHKIGDGLLVEIAGRITACIRSGDTLARLGGDEFVVLCEDVEQPEYYFSVAQKIIETVSSTIIIQSHTIHVGASVGIAIFPDDGKDSVTLMKSADTAMYAAKMNGRGISCFFQAKMSEEAAVRMKMDVCLRQALANHEFTLYYQPKMDAKNQTTYGYEALLRWNSPELGMVSPADFIPLAESTRLIVDIGRWVIDEACRQIAAWQVAGFGLKQVAVNISALQLKSVKLAGQFSEACKRHGIPTAALEAELTESVVMADPDQTAVIFQELRGIGIRLAIDDFGTGYSSLAYLRRLPFDVLKIDRSFIMNADKDEDDAQIVLTILALGKALRLDVVAEGVETEAQAKMLREAGCNIFQGYLFSRPLTVSDVERRFREEAGPAVRQIMRALIVDDSARTRDLIKLVLEAYGPTEIVTAKNGAEAIVALQAGGVDIVFMDCRMEGMDGLECTRRIRAGIDRIDPNITIIMLTCMGDRNTEKEADAAGCDLFIRKPFSLNHLHACLEKVLGRA